MAITQGITSRSFLPANMATDDLESAQGYNGAGNVTVEYNDGGVREQIRSLPKTLPVSPLSMPKHAAGKPSRSQRPARSR